MKYCCCKVPMHEIKKLSDRECAEAIYNLECFFRGRVQLEEIFDKGLYAVVIDERDWPYTMQSGDYNLQLTKSLVITLSPPRRRPAECFRLPPISVLHGKIEIPATPTRSKKLLLL